MPQYDWPLSDIKDKDVNKIFVGFIRPYNGNDSLPYYKIDMNSDSSSCPRNSSGTRQKFELKFSYTPSVLSFDIYLKFPFKLKEESRQYLKLRRPV